MSDALVLRPLSDVARLNNFHIHKTKQLSEVKSKFDEKDLVTATELLDGEQINIARDRTGNIMISNAFAAEHGLTIGHYAYRSFGTKIADFMFARPIPLCQYWDVAYKSKLINKLRDFPQICDIQIVGVIIPWNDNHTYGMSEPDIKIVRVLIDGIDQPYHSFFENWAPLLFLGKYDFDRVQSVLQGPEKVSGKGLHARKGVVIRHYKMRHLPTGEPLIAKWINPEFKA